MSETRYTIIPMTRDVASAGGVEAAGRKMKFGKTGSLMVKDSGVASAIKDKYGKDVDIWDVTSEWHPSDRGHKYRFTGLALPWHKECPLCGRQVIERDQTYCSICLKENEVANRRKEEM